MITCWTKFAIEFHVLPQRSKLKVDELQALCADTQSFVPALKAVLAKQAEKAAKVAKAKAPWTQSEQQLLEALLKSGKCTFFNKERRMTPPRAVFHLYFFIFWGNAFPPSPPLHRAFLDIVLYLVHQRAVLSSWAPYVS